MFEKDIKFLVRAWNGTGFKEYGILEYTEDIDCFVLSPSKNGKEITGTVTELNTSCLLFAIWYLQGFVSPNELTLFPL